jgi:hypothetical protein
MCEYSDAIKIPKSYSLPPPLGGQGLHIKSFLAGKRGKKEVAATVHIKTIKYYVNMKYTLKKSKKKKSTQ